MLPGQQIGRTGESKLASLTCLAPWWGWLEAGSFGTINQSLSDMAVSRWLVFLREGCLPRMNVPRSCLAVDDLAWKVTQHHIHSILLVRAIKSPPRFRRKGQRPYLLMYRKKPPTQSPFPQCIWSTAIVLR